MEKTILLEYLGEGEMEVAGVGVFGGDHWDPDLKQWVKTTILECNEKTAKELESDPRFKVYYTRDTEAQPAQMKEDKHGG